MILLTDNDELDCYFPEKFDECSLLDLVKWQQLKMQETTLEVFAVEWLKHFMPEVDFNKLLLQNTTEEVAEWANIIIEIFLSASAGLTQQKILGIEELQLKGADDCLGNICFGQFVEADEQFLLFFKTKKDEHLHKLIAILYRPKAETSYDNSINEANAQKLGKLLSKEYQLIVYDFYAGCRQFIGERFPKVFPKLKDDEKQKPLLFKTIKQTTIAYHQKMVQYAKSPERKKNVYQENAYTVLEFIEYDIIEYLEMEKRLKK